MLRVVVDTPRLRLREWQRTDAAVLQEICSDEEVVRYLEGRPWTHEDAAGFLDDMLSRRDLGCPETWAVEESASNELIGWCGFASTNAPWLRRDFVVEVGWTIARSRWGLGLATEAAWAVIDLKLYDPARVISKCHEDNARSEAVMRRIGMTPVGMVKAREKRTRLYRL